MTRLFLAFALLLTPMVSFAHPGGTDASGGHRCWTDCEAWGLMEGEYHYHDTEGTVVQTLEGNEALFDLELTQRMGGYILLQVEDHGEAWYVRKSEAARYYMPHGAAAYDLMRYYSLGVSNADLATIPTVADTTEMNTVESICDTNALANRLRGDILLQVEQHGEAWYVSPEKCYAIYMEDGDAAYEIMRYLGLGISNADLSRIPAGPRMPGILPDEWITIQ